MNIKKEFIEQLIFEGKGLESQMMSIPITNIATELERCYEDASYIPVSTESELEDIYSSWATKVYMYFKENMGDQDSVVRELRSARFCVSSRGYKCIMDILYAKHAVL